MIKILRLQKAVIAFILGVAALVAYWVMNEDRSAPSNLMLTLAGIFFIAGSLMFLYPILFAKKDKEGCVELDPEKQEEIIAGNENAIASEVLDDKGN